MGLRGKERTCYAEYSVIKVQVGGFHLFPLLTVTKICKNRRSYLQKNGSKKRQISAMEKWRTNSGYYYAESHGAIMPI